MQRHLFHLLHRASLVVVLIVAWVVSFAGVSRAVVVNGDFDAVASGTTHVGADGALSNSGGTVWNRVNIGINASNLADQFGGATPVDLTFVGNSNVNNNPSSTNNIQDVLYSGNGFIIGDLVPGGSYSFVAYIGGNTGFNVVDANGSHLTPFSNTPTYALPGTLNSDYRRIDNLVPFDTGGGVIGLRVQNLDGSIGGFQLSGPVPEPSSISLLVFTTSLLRARRRTRR